MESNIGAVNAELKYQAAGDFAGMWIGNHPGGMSSSCTTISSNKGFLPMHCPICQIIFLWLLLQVDVHG
jgi:hypothetical protein